MLGMNRRERRAAKIGARDDRAPPIPPLRIKLARIDPFVRKVTMETMSMTPDAAQAFMGKRNWHQLVIGHENGADVVIMGDNFPQVAILGVPEPKWMLRGSNFGPNPICHGIGGVLGLLVEAKKATTLPIGIEWVLERIEWEPSEEEQADG